MSTPEPLPGPLSGWPSQVYFFFRLRAVRYLFCWLVALTVATLTLRHAWHVHDDPKRADGNRGHVLIDFGGQWLHARMLVEGHGRQLYYPDVQKELIRRHYLEEAGAPTKWPQKNDSDQLLDWLVTVSSEKTSDGKTLRGPLYPPLHAFYYAPLAQFPPQQAYRIMQVFLVLCLLITAFGINRLSRGRVWTPLAFSLLFAFPGCSGALILGQNPPISLMLFVWGWVALSRRRPYLAGFLWALLAFKPVWAVVLCLVPLLTLRWKMLFTMMATGLILILVTLPFTGVQSWLDWQKVGSEASRTYEVDYNWIQISRDCLGLPRRWMVRFYEPVPMVQRVGKFLADVSEEAEPWHEILDRPEPAVQRVGTLLIYASEKGNPKRDFWKSAEPALTKSSHRLSSEERRENWLSHTLIGFAILGFLLEVTVRRCLLQPQIHSQLSGWPVTFVMLGSLFCCYHYIYYDLFLFALPIALLALRPYEYFLPVFWRRTASPIPPQTVDYYSPKLPRRYPLTKDQPRALWTRNSFVICLVALICTLHQWEWVWWDNMPDVMIPWAQFGLLMLWGWSCIAWMKDSPPDEEADEQHRSEDVPATDEKKPAT